MWFQTVSILSKEPQMFSVHPCPSWESIHLLRSDLPGTSQCSKPMQGVFTKSCSPLLVTFSHKGEAGVSDLQNGNDISFLPSQDALAVRTLSWASELELALTSSAFFHSSHLFAVTLSLLNCMFSLRFYLNLYF